LGSNGASIHNPIRQRLLDSGGKRFTIRPNPLEPGHPFRYILPVHTTCLGCPESAEFPAVFEALRRGAENPSLSASCLTGDEKPSKIRLSADPRFGLCSTAV
jgi:hypothetical protein